MDPKEFTHLAARAGIDPLHRAAAPQVRIAFTFCVEDAQALWDAAAERGLAAPGMELDDVIDVIGPREDPSVTDCLAMLVRPIQAGGCRLEQIEATDCPAPAPRLAA